MSETRPHTARLPAEPNLRHLKEQAKERLKNGEAWFLSEALFQTARFYGFQSWPKLRSYVLARVSAEDSGQAIDPDDPVENPLTDSMKGSITGWVLDEATGISVMSADVRLYRVGVPGETRAELDEQGRFSFSALASGQYSLAIYDPGYVTRYEPITLEQDETIRDLRISLIRGAYISGQIVDEQGLPPKRSWFTLLREGERRGRTGYISNSGDHQVAEDGTFCSPPLAAGRYLLRFSGLLHDFSLAQGAPEFYSPMMQQRLFDFLYADAHDVTEAIVLPVQSGQRFPELKITIPRPVWYTVRGKVTGSLPEERKHICVMFARDLGAVDQIGGWGGLPVQPDGSFEHMALRGRYSLDICESSPPDSTGMNHIVRRFGSATITVGDEDLSGVEIAATSEGQN